MSDVGRFGVFLPSYIWEGDGAERARGIKSFARRVEELGFDSLFITDHLLAARRFYSVNWLEPLISLAVAAGATERVRLGTSILIMPLRNPVILAKELATLQFLSDNRVILGAGVGWNDAEYDAVGVHKSERGKRTDEMLDIMMPLLEGETVTYHGQFYSVDDVFIEPRTEQRPLLWIGGGSQLADPKSPDVPKFVQSVKARTVKSDGWIPRPTCPPQDIARDWVELQAAMREAGKDPRDTLVAHENFLHLVMTDDPVKAREEQHRTFLKVMSNERGPAYLESVYLFGTPDEIIASLQARVDAGVEYFFLHTMTPDPDQLQQWVDDIIPNVTLPGHRRPGPPAADAPGAMTRRVALLGQAAPATPLAGHARRGVRRGRDRRPVRAPRARADEVAAAVDEARGPDWLGLRVTAPYKRLVAGCATRSRRDAPRSAPSTASARTAAAGWSASTPMRPASAPASSWPWAVTAPRPRSSWPGRAGRPTRSSSPAGAQACAG